MPNATSQLVYAGAIASLGADGGRAIPWWPRVVEPRLPEIDASRLPGTRLVQLAVPIVLLGPLITAALILAAMSVVTVNVTVRALGNIEPVRVWPVRARDAGTVAEVLVATGDTVRRGAPLVRLDSLASAVAVADAEAQLATHTTELERLQESAPIIRRQAANALEQAEARVLRARAGMLQHMVDFGLGNDVDSLLHAYHPGHHVVLDAAMAEVRQAEGDVVQAREQMAHETLITFDVRKAALDRRRLGMQLAADRAMRERATLIAPGTGVVLTEQIERLPGAAVRPGDVVLEVADIGSWRATLNVGERDIHRVRVGDVALLRIPALAALRTDPVRGRVTAVAAEPAGAGSEAVGGVAPGAPAGGGSYRVSVALDRAQVDSLGFDVVRRGYGTQATIVTRRARALVLVREWLYDHMSGRGA